MKIFESFNNELTKLAEIDPLKDVSTTSPHTLQVMAFHLTFECIIERWIDYKINKGKKVFEGIDKIGFHNKLYIAKNIGLPKKLFNVLNKINDERNKFAHQIHKKGIDKKEILEIARLANEIDCTGGKFEDLGIYENGKLLRASDTSCDKVLLLLSLHAVFGKLRNFAFSDIHLSTSKECPPDDPTQPRK